MHCLRATRKKGDERERRMQEPSVEQQQQQQECEARQGRRGLLRIMMVLSFMHHSLTL